MSKDPEPTYFVGSDAHNLIIAPRPIGFDQISVQQLCLSVSPFIIFICRVVSIYELVHWVCLAICH